LVDQLGMATSSSKTAKVGPLQPPFFVRLNSTFFAVVTTMLPYEK